MKEDPVLYRAAAYCRKGRYGEAIRLLEPEVVRYHDSFMFYYILAVCCLNAKDYGGAHTYLRRAREIKLRNPNVLLGLAVLHLRRGETDRAVDLYLEVLDLDPKNNIAKRGLSVIRKHGEADDLSAWLESGRMAALFPPKPKGRRRNIGLISIILFCGAAALLVSGLYVSGLFETKQHPGTSRPGLDVSLLEEEELANPVQLGGAYRYILTRSQVVDTYEKAADYFSAYRDEAAKLQLNRILESNASEAVKNKARLLLSYTSVPGFDTLQDRFTYRQVAEEPHLYRDVHVIWQGTAANIYNADTFTSFDFLVGYDTRTVLEGTVKVHLPFAASIDPERPLEVLGRIIPSTTDTLRNPFSMEGVALHQSARLGGSY